VINRASDGAIKVLIGQDFLGKVGEVLVLRNLAGVRTTRVVLVGQGKQAEFNVKTFAKAEQVAARQCVSLRVADACSTLLLLPCPNSDTRQRARLSAQAYWHAAYVYDATIGKPDPLRKPKLRKVSVLCDKAQDKTVALGLSEGDALGQGMSLTRTLGNLPGNICTPAYLGNQARALGRQFKSIKVSVLEKKQIEALGMGSFLSVARGSVEAPRFIVMHYKGSGASAAKNQAKSKSVQTNGPIVLVGKGITFDSGGISIKPAAAMDEMKYDMCGAASVFGTMLAIAKLDWPGELIGLVPACENMPSGNANKPGDVVTSMSGQTIEILNTDAEGRLILCDALTYAERFKPSAVIDIATLTGACIVALGSVNTGLFSPDDALADELVAASRRALDPAWRLPVEEEYQESLKSNFADIANIGGPKGGAVTAACFLARFAKAYRWAHLDIAGTSWLSGPNKGASGRPVPMLLEYLLSKTEGGA
jgi:leucyl aminopeptidase